MTTYSNCPPATTNTAAPGAPDFSAIKLRQQQAWGSGDYAVVGTLIVLVAEDLCEAADIRPGERVLDVATGHGNSALAAARRFGRVTGVDYVPTLLARARDRAAVERLPVDFQDGDAERLPFPDASFDVVLSSFGVMFAPDQARAASELLRVCKPGGRIALASWTPDSIVARMFHITGRFLPPPAGLTPPATWGDEQHLRKLFGAQLKRIESKRREFVFRYASFDHWMQVMGKYYGPMQRAFEALEPKKRAELAAAIEQDMRASSRSKDETLIVPSSYLESVIVRA